MNREVKCPKCNGTGFYSGRYGQTACEECINGKVLLKKLNKRRKSKKGMTADEIANIDTID